MKRFVAACVVVWIACIARPADACLVARQMRLVVLGGSSDQLVALEIELVRDGELETAKEWFFITPRLLSLRIGKNGTVATRTLVHEWSRKRVKAHDVQAWLHTVFDRASELARKQQGLVPAAINKRVRCEYLGHCGDYRMVEKGLQKSGKALYPVVTPAPFVAANGGPVNDYRDLGIDRIDSVQIGTRRVAIIGVGYGWDQNPCNHVAGTCTDDRVLRTLPTPASVRAGLKHCRGLHHGNEWDVLVAQ